MIKNKVWFVIIIKYIDKGYIFMKIVDNKNTKNKVLNIEKHIKQEKINNWEKDNQKAIDFYNKRIKENGLFSDALRLF